MLTRLDVGDSIVVAKCLSHMLNLDNLAEEFQIAYRRRIKLKKGDMAGEASATTESDIEETFKRLVGEFKKPHEEIFKSLKNQTVDLVLTAHSTQSVRRSWLQKHATSVFCSLIWGITCLSRALRDENSKLLMAVSALALPIQPLMVSAVHTGMMEVAFAKRALKDPNLKMAHNMHKMSSLLGAALFIADDALPQTPFLHAACHLAAAVGVATCNEILE